MTRLLTVDLRRRLRALGPPWVVDMGVAMACLAISVVVRLVVDQISPGALSLGIIYPICLLATLLAGWRAGVITLALGGLFSWYFVLNQGHGFHLADLKAKTNVALFFLTALLIIFLADQAVIE